MRAAGLMVLSLLALSNVVDAAIPGYLTGCVGCLNNNKYYCPLNNTCSATAATGCINGTSTTSYAQACFNQDQSVPQNLTTYTISQLPPKIVYNDLTINAGDSYEFMVKS